MNRCLSVLKTATFIGCPNGHTYCKLCCKKSRNSSNKCPSCRRRLKNVNFAWGEELEKNHAKGQCVEKLRVKCRYKGCDWRGMLSGYEKHVLYQCLKRPGAQIPGENESFQLFVKNLSGKSIALNDIQPTTTIKEIKQQIFNKEAIPIKEQR